MKTSKSIIIHMQLNKIHSNSLKNGKKVTTVINSSLPDMLFAVLITI